MRNPYILVRHGFSEANEKGIITSSPAVAVEKYGLTAKGRDQARRFRSSLEKLSVHDTKFITDST